MKTYRWAMALAIPAALALPAAGQASGSGEKAYAEMSLTELLNMKVVSASNTAEKLSEAPATVIVITREEIRQRGYTDLSQALDDLPGMDVVRPYGDTYLKDYWRGYRNTIGEPFLLMVDGIIQNHLYYNTAEAIVAIPLSNIDRVEVVYGPASAVYGPNAFMGVINVITVKDLQASGTRVDATLTGGSNGTRILDANAIYKKDDFRFTATARFDDGDLDSSKAGAYEYTKNKYYADPRLWGGFVNNPNLGGSFLSPHHNRGADVRAFLGEFELGMQYYQVNSGYGTEYAGDAAQNNAVWDRPQLGIFGRVQHDFAPNLTSTTLVRYRKSDLTNDSTFVEGYNITDSAGKTERVVDFSYWQSLNSSWSLYQDFDWKPSNALGITAGLKYEQKDLQKAYDNPYGPSLPPDQLNPSTYQFPTPPVASTQTQNRITTEDYGVYAQARYRLSEGQLINFGVRADHNSQYGTAPTIRAGYVGTFGDFGLKALYGQAFQEPTPRLLYGGWRGSGSDPSLDPEKSQTVELSGTYTKPNASALASLWWVKNRDTIVNTVHGAANLGDRKVIGLDLHLQARIPVSGLKQLRAWGYYSHIFTEDESKISSQGIDLGTGDIGDLARDKVMVGITAVAMQHFQATLRARWIGMRDTVSTNPVGSVPSWTTVDLSASWDGIGVPGLGLQVTATNLLDKTYFEPGVRDAGAGTTPGYFDASGVWQGSQSFYSSLLAQPGRQILVSAILKF